VSELGRVLDRSTLDDADGPRVRVRIAVPRAWASERALIVVEAPERLPCGRCDGGGCDACERSGSFRLDPDPALRSFTLTLPVDLGSGVVLRVTRPFGESSAIGQALCEVRPSSEPSGCRRVPTPAPLVSVARAARPSLGPKLLPIVIVVFAALVTWLFVR
jgi:hypothetical protein